MRGAPSPSTSYQMRMSLFVAYGITIAPKAFTVRFSGTLTARLTLHTSGPRPKRSVNGRCANQDFVLLTGACQRAYVRLGSGSGRRRRHDVAAVLFRTRPSCLSYHSRKERATP